MVRHESPLGRHRRSRALPPPGDKPPGGGARRRDAGRPDRWPGPFPANRAATARPRARLHARSRRSPSSRRAGRLVDSRGARPPIERRRRPCAGARGARRGLRWRRGLDRRARPRAVGLLARHLAPPAAPDARGRTAPVRGGRHAHGRRLHGAEPRPALRAPRRRRLGREPRAEPRQRRALLGHRRRRDGGGASRRERDRGIARRAAASRLRGGGPICRHARAARGREPAARAAPPQRERSARARPRLPVRAPREAHLRERGRREDRPARPQVLLDRRGGRPDQRGHPGLRLQRGDARRSRGGDAAPPRLDARRRPAGAAELDGPGIREGAGAVSRAAALALALALALAACPAPRSSLRPPPAPPPAGPHAPPLPLAPADQHDEPALAGVVHVVLRGETINRIARAYGIDPADLMETNGVADPRTVAVGAELFVPGATRVVEVPPAPVPGDPAHAAAAPTTTATRTPIRTPISTATLIPTPTSAHPERSAAEGGAESKETPTPIPTATTPDAPLAWPLKGVLYGSYGVRAGRRHDGIDIAAPEGTSVAAAAAGTVIYAGEQAGYGAIVIVRHEGGLVTLYAHASRLLVEEGAHVRRGEPIAKVGQTGRTTGPHLHFKVRDGTQPKNQLLFLP